MLRKLWFVYCSHLANETKYTFLLSQYFVVAILQLVEKRFFGIDLSERGTEVVLSEEHTECAWLPFGRAHELLEYSDDRTGLWELHRRILTDDLPIR